MKILLAPSEKKAEGGIDTFKLNTLLFNKLHSTRLSLVHSYSKIIDTNDFKILSVMFGLKKEHEICNHLEDLMHKPTLKAVERYTGIAFDYLKYNELDIESKSYLDTNLLIFSNLFGVLRANDKIPSYRLKQAMHIDNINPAKVYKPLLQAQLDNYLEGNDILDLRAVFYNKYYTPSLPYTTLKFLKNGKVVSHWAKAYRGIVLREIALKKINSLDAFIRLPIRGLSLYEIQTKKLNTEIIYEIE